MIIASFSDLTLGSLEAALTLRISSSLSSCDNENTQYTDNQCLKRG